MDRNNLRALGWSEELIDAMERAQTVVELAIEVGQSAHRSAVVDRISTSLDLGETLPVATHGVAAFVRS